MNNLSPNDLVLAIAGIAGILILYFLPVIVANIRGVENTTGVFLVNLVTGWSGLGWLAAFVWACAGKTRPLA